MNDQEMRIAISGACGWTHLYCEGNYVCSHAPNKTSSEDLPDYPTDLNAIQSACLETLGARERIEFCRWLDEVTEQPGTRQRSDYMASRCVLATARQRCEAFLRTIGRWQD